MSNKNSIIKITWEDRDRNDDQEKLMNWRLETIIKRKGFDIRNIMPNYTIKKNLKICIYNQEIEEDTSLTPRIFFSNN